MRLILLLVLLVSLKTSCFAADTVAATNSEAVMREKLFQRFITEMEQAGIVTNRDSSVTNMLRIIFDGSTVHSSFGLSWDEVPGPTLTGSNSLAAVNSFVATNGWNMETNSVLVMEYSKELKHIRGLPWEAIKDREFQAETHKGILYVMLGGWHHNLNGIAYNPKTNIFASRIKGFKPIGQHWYVWAQPEDPIFLPQKYEGQKP